MLLCANHWAGADLSASGGTCFCSDKVNTALQPWSQLMLMSRKP